MVSSTKRLALRLGHFLALECFQSLLVFPDDNKLEYNQARLQLKETNCLFALSVSLIVRYARQNLHTLQTYENKHSWKLQTYRTEW